MISLQRTTGWEQRLFAYTSGMLAIPFDYGTNDCVLFAASCVEVMTGVDLATEYRGKYNTKAGALRIIAETGADSLGDFVASFLPEKEVSFMQRGDLGIFEGEDGDFVGVCQGKECIGPTRLGLVRIKTLSAHRAFKV